MVFSIIDCAPGTLAQVVGSPCDVTRPPKRCAQSSRAPSPTSSTAGPDCV